MNEESIFAAALQKNSPEERAAFLDDACQGNPRLRADVEELLEASDRAGGFLETSQVRDFSPTADGPTLAEGAGTVIGPYKLLQQIGEGGMGVVFMAEQSDPIQRTVALKIIKPGMDTRQVIARFEAERQALALMDHPNIAKVLDAGVVTGGSPVVSGTGEPPVPTAPGRPYFVMELVKGVPITKYCDEKHLSLCERLSLFMPVCQAVQHAHQKGIIHRDIKPTNVLVAEYDNRAVPKVIDFGVAKATAQKLTERTMFTEFGQLVGTFEYMSPEQAKLNQLDIDTRSDIYSLGVLLYELLTGSTPFEQKRFKEAAFDEVLRIIREEEPPKPSTRLSSQHSLPLGGRAGEEVPLATIAANRHTEPAKLSKDVRGELDWIVMKALDKDRNRRYETANGFAMDVQRYLADEPVLACPPSTGYRAKKFVQRNKGPVLAVSLILLSLVGGMLGTTFGLIRAENARRAEAEQRKLSQANERKALASAESEKTAKQAAQAREAETAAVLDFVEKKIFAAARPQGQEGGLGQGVTLRKAVEAALPFVVTSFTDQPLIEARLRMTIGTSFAYLGDYKIAVEQYQAARALYTEHRGADHPDTLGSMHNLAISFHYVGRHGDALKLGEETLALKKAKLGPDHPDTLGCMSNLAVSYYELGRLADALQLFEETLRLQKARLGPDHPDTLESMGNLANGYYVLGRHADALKLYEETLVLMKTKHGPDHPDTLLSMTNLASIYAALARHAEALELREETLALRQAKPGLDHPDTLTSMCDLANTFQDLGRHAEAVKLYEETLTLQKVKLGPDHPHTLRSMTGLAGSYSALGRHTDALKLGEETLALMKAKLGPEHPMTLGSMNDLAGSYADLGRHADSLKLNEETLRLRKAKLGPDHPDTLISMNNLATSYKSVGRHAEALKLGEETLTLLNAKLGPDHPYTIASMSNLVNSYCALGRHDDALPIIDDCLARAAGKEAVHPGLIPSLLQNRLRIFQMKKDPAGCLETAAKWEALGRTDVVSLYWSAAYRAVCAAVIRETDTTPAGDAKATEQADLAMAWLTQAAAAAGNLVIENIKQDKDLDALRDREDFKKLLAELEK
jgi:serine/threonine protein kinase/tetratricopeptide (TPR) repeat protein